MNAIQNSISLRKILVVSLSIWYFNHTFNGLGF